MNVLSYADMYRLTYALTVLGEILWDDTSPSHEEAILLLKRVGLGESELIALYAKLFEAMLESEDVPQNS